MRAPWREAKIAGEELGVDSVFAKTHSQLEAGAATWSGAHPAADGFPLFGVVADDAQRGGDGNGEEKSHAAPDPSPKEQRNRDGDGVELNAAANKLRRDEVLREDVDAGEDAGNHHEDADGVPLGQGEEKRRQPGEHGAEIGNHVQETGNEPHEDRIVQAKKPEEEAADGHDEQRDDTHAEKVVPQNVAQVLKCFLNLRPARGRKKLQGAVPGLTFAGQHEENEERHEGDFEKQRVKRAHAAQDERVEEILLDSSARGGLRTAADSGDFGFDGVHGFAENVAVLGPARSKLRGARPERIAEAAEEGDEEKDADQRADGAGNAHAFEQIDEWIEKVGEEDGKKKRDDDALGVIAEEENDGGGDDA